MGKEIYYKECLFWYAYLMKKGIPAAYNNVGWMHKLGRGTPKNDGAAINNFEKSITFPTAHYHAYLNLSAMLYKGRGCKADQARAFNLFKVALQKEEKLIFIFSILHAYVYVFY